MYFEDYEEEHKIVQVPSHPSNLPKTGWLKKQSKKSTDKYSFIYLTYSDSILHLFKQPNDKAPKNSIDFSKGNVSVNLLPLDHPKFLFIYPHGSSCIILTARDSHDLQTWYDVLSVQASHSVVLPSYYRGMELKPGKIHYNDFFSVVQTGDLLLFKSANRTFRVSLTILYPDSDVGFLQADSVDGVSIIMAEEFFDQFKRQRNTRLALRQLKIERSSELLMKFEEFVKGFERKRFNISPVSLLQSENSGQEEVAACSSELVASAYKAMGLISSDSKASKFVPEDFSSTRRISLIGAKLGNEVSIDLGVS